MVGAELALVLAIVAIVSVATSLLLLIAPGGDEAAVESESTDAQRRGVQDPTPSRS